MKLASSLNRFVRTAWGRVKYLIFMPPSDRAHSSSVTPRRKATRPKRAVTRPRRLAGATGK